MDGTQFQQATGYAIDLLRHNLLPVLTYHSLHHTLEVATFCKRLAELEGIDEKNIQLLLTAAHFHDTGLTSISSIDVDVYNAAPAIARGKSRADCTRDPSTVWHQSGGNQYGQSVDHGNEVGSFTLRSTGANHLRRRHVLDRKGTGIFHAIQPGAAR